MFRELAFPPSSMMYLYVLKSVPSDTRISMMLLTTTTARSGVPKVPLKVEPKTSAWTKVEIDKKVEVEAQMANQVRPARWLRGNWKGVRRGGTTALGCGWWSRKRGNAGGMMTYRRAVGRNMSLEKEHFCRKNMVKGVFRRTRSQRCVEKNDV